MIALVLMSLCLSGIVGQRWNNLLFKPLMGFVSDDDAITSAITKPTFGDVQKAVDDDDDTMLKGLSDNSSNDRENVEGTDGDVSVTDGNADVENSVLQRRRQRINRKNLIQHLYTDYGYLTSIEGWTKLKENFDFDMLLARSNDCKRFESGIDELLNGGPSEIYGKICYGPPDKRQTLVNAKGKNDKASTASTAAIADNHRSSRLFQPPVKYYADFFKEEIKRAGTLPVIGCDCKVKIDLIDLGQQHYPRYLMNAICQSTNQSPNEYPQKCWRGTHCKPLEYKVKVLTPRTILDQGQKDPALAWLPDELRQNWKFQTITVAVGCFCSY